MKVCCGRMKVANVIGGDGCCGLSAIGRLVRGVGWFGARPRVIGFGLWRWQLFLNRECLSDPSRLLMLGYASMWSWVVWAVIGGFNVFLVALVVASLFRQPLPYYNLICRYSLILFLLWLLVLSFASMLSLVVMVMARWKVLSTHGCFDGQGCLVIWRLGLPADGPVLY